MYIYANERYGTGAELWRRATLLSPTHKAPVVGLAPNGEEVVLDHTNDGAPARFVLARDFISEAPTVIGKSGSTTFAEQAAVRERALRAVGTPYNLLTWNCEHLTRYVTTGKAESPQLAVGVGCVALLALLFVASNQ
jgi:hypothetical protein